MSCRSELQKSSCGACGHADLEINATRRLLGTARFPVTGNATRAPCALDGVALDAAAEVEHLARLGMEDDVVAFDGALDPTRLIRAFEVAGKLVALLLELDGFCLRAVLGAARGLDGPFAGDIDRRRSLIGQRLLSRYSGDEA